METKQIVSIIVVVVVIAAIAAVAVVSLNDDDVYYSTGEDGRLMVYGNANNDDYLDEQDVAYLEAIIAGEADETPYADANQDGVIDEDDIEFVEQMIDRVPMTIYYHNNQSGTAVAINYPITNVVTINTEVCLANKILGNTANMVAYNGTLDEVLFSDVPEDSVKLSSSSEIPLETLSELDVDAVVAIASSSYVTNETEIMNSGIDVLKLGFKDADPTAAYITYGYLLGQEERALDFAEFVDETLEYIDETVSASVAYEDRVTGMVLGYNVIYGNVVSYGNVIDMAGGINAVDWYEHRYVRDGMEWLYEYDFDYIVGLVSGGGYDYSVDEDADEEIATTWNNHVNTHQLTEAYQNGHMVLSNTTVPTIINAAYLAAEFYPDLFPENYGDLVHQQFVDQFIDNLSEIGYDVTDGLFLITSDDIV